MSRSSAGVLKTGVSELGASPIISTDQKSSQQKQYGDVSQITNMSSQYTLSSVAKPVISPLFAAINASHSGSNNSSNGGEVRVKSGSVASIQSYNSDFGSPTNNEIGEGLFSLDDDAIEIDDKGRESSGSSASSVSVSTVVPVPQRSGSSSTTVVKQVVYEN